MTEFVRKMRFRSHDLGSAATLVLTFDDDKIPDLYKTVYPIAFTVSEFGKTGGYFLDVVYKKQFGFTWNETTERRPASAYSRPIKAGQETSLTKEGGLYEFSEPKDVVPPIQQVVARNETKSKEEIGFAFFLNPTEPPSNVLLFDPVGSGYSAQIQFSPILRAYITTDYKEGAVIRHPVNSPIVFREDLRQLEEETKWRLTYNSGTGRFAINQET